MNNTGENVQKSKNQTPRRLGLGLRSPRNLSTQKAPSTSKTAVKLFHSPVIDESTPTKKRKTEPKTLPSSFIPMNERSIDEIQMNIKQMECRLTKYENNEKRTNELGNMIEKWRVGGQAALQMLQDDINPKQELAVILKHLNLPENIFDAKHSE